MIPSRLVAVTDGGSLLGQAVVLRLLAQGWRVRQLVSSPIVSSPAGVEIVRGGLEDSAALDQLVKGAEAVVQTAMIDRARSQSQYFDINVEGAYRLGRSVRAWAPMARLVVVSSLVARFPWLSAHAASIADGEDALIETAGNCSWSVLRLGPVYGPRDPKTLLMMRNATLPLMPIPNLPLARISPLQLDDAASLIAAACAYGGTEGKAVWDVGEGAYSWLEIARAVRRAVGETPRLVRVPLALVSLGIILTHPLGSGETRLLSPGRLCEMFHNVWAARPQNVPPETVWRPSTALEAGLFDAAHWFRVNGWLKEPETLSASRIRG